MDDERPSLKNYFVRKDVLSDRVSLTPLAWVALGVALLFATGILFGAYGLMTGRLTNPVDAVADLVYPPTPVVIPTATKAPPTVVPTLAPTWVITPTVLPTVAKSPVAPTKTVTPTKALNTKPLGTATPPSTWQVFAVDVGGRKLYDAPPNIRTWVLTDFNAYMQYWHDHLNNPAQIAAQLKTFASGSYYQTMYTTFTSTTQDGLVMGSILDAPRLAAPDDRPSVVEFSADGQRARVVFNSAKGTWKAYDPKTKTVVSLPGLSPYLLSWSLQYDAASKHWKVSEAAKPVAQPDE